MMIDRVTLRIVHVTRAGRCPLAPCLMKTYYTLRGGCCCFPVTYIDSPDPAQLAAVLRPRYLPHPRCGSALQLLRLVQLLLSCTVTEHNDYSISALSSHACTPALRVASSITCDIGCWRLLRGADSGAHPAPSGLPTDIPVLEPGPCIAHTAPRPRPRGTAYHA